MSPHSRWGAERDGVVAAIRLAVAVGIEDFVTGPVEQPEGESRLAARERQFASRWGRFRRGRCCLAVRGRSGRSGSGRGRGRLAAWEDVTCAQVPAGITALVRTTGPPLAACISIVNSSLSFFGSPSLGFSTQR